MNARDGDGRTYWTAAELREHPLFPEAFRRAIKDALNNVWDGEYHPDLQAFVATAIAHVIERQREYQEARNRAERRLEVILGPDGVTRVDVK